jgi:tetratricopeptide (TPR) repeat protein
MVTIGFRSLLTSFALLLLLGGAASLGSGCASSATGRADTEAETPAPRRAQPAPAKRPGAAEEALGEANDAYARRHLIRGLTRARVGDTASAVRHYRRALEAAPEAPAVLSALADAQAARGDLSTALYHARRARRFGTAAAADGNDDAHYTRQLARLYRQAGQTEQAVATYQALLERAPDDRRALRSLARLQAGAGQPQRALDAYERLTDGHADAPPTGPPVAILTEMLELYRRTGDAAGTERTLNALIRRAPDRNAHRRALAQLYRKRDRPSEAAAVLEEALTHAPTDPETTALLADAYRAAGRPEQAAALEEQSAARFDAAGASADQLAERARLRYRDGDAGDATERLLREALAKDSTHAASLALLGRLRFEAGAFAEAAALLGRALAQDPRAPKRWARAAQAFLEAGRPARAAAMADEGLLLFPGRLALLRAHATALARDEQPAAAARRFEDALRVMKAEGLLDDGAAAAPVERAARFHDTLARLYDRQDAPEKARRHREQARTLRERLQTAVSSE